MMYLNKVAILVFSVLIARNDLKSQPNAFHFQDYELKLAARINHYDTTRYNLLTHKINIDISSGNQLVSFSGSNWEVSSAIKRAEADADHTVYDISISFTCLSGTLTNASVSADLLFDNWDRQNYVLMPGAVYNGNRYPSVKLDYMPFATDTSQIGLNKPILLSDQPRLNYKDGYSRIQERSGAMTLPSIGFRSVKDNRGFWMCFNQGNSLGDYQVDIEEANKGKSATISLTSPVVRELTRYSIANNQFPSTDKLANFKSGDKIVMEFQINLFPCASVQGLFDKLVQLRQINYAGAMAKSSLPFSSAFEIVEKKFNRENWREAGYYATGVSNNFFDNWQIGWIGGMMTTLPLLAEGSETTRERVIKNFDWLFPQGISPSGYYYDLAYKGKFYGAFPNKALGDDLVLTRKNADATYYIFKQFDLMKKLNLPVKEEWVKGNLKALDAQVNTWKKYGQLGQFVNQQTGELFIGNTTSAGIFPASLCAAYRYTKDSVYLKLAKDIGDYYYQKFISNGLACGGPGDAVQSFDSESSYGLLEGLTELYETTSDKKWLSRAEEMANQFSTWVVAYDYNFPPASLFGKLGFSSKGAVYANTQNKHAAPGICTHSGIALLKLYRATANSFYINLLRDIAHAIPQYMSTKEKPITCMHEGWVNERVNMTDWLEGIGEVFCGSTWAETALLLSTVELPGIYVDLDKRKSYDFDHVESKIIVDKKGVIKLEIHNLTIYDATVKVFAENGNEMLVPLGMNAFTKWKAISVKAGETIQIRLK
jgi:hypothetical protein